MVKLRSQTARTRTLRNRVIADDNHNNNNNNNRKGKLSKKRSREQQSDETSAGKRFQPDDRQPDDRQPDDIQPNDRQADDIQPDDRQADDIQPDDRQPDDMQPDDRQADDIQPDDRQPVQEVQEEPEDVGTDIVNANWQILGFIDAELTEKLIDCQTLETHKLCFHSDFQSFLLRDPKAEALYTQMFKSYLDSLENVSFLTTSKYEPQDGFTQMRVVAKKKFRPKTVISGLQGFTETVSDDELTEDMSFSVFAPTNNFKSTRIMLGPASFVNHECNPNARYVVSGEKNKTIISIQAIAFYSPDYSPDYFGDNNRNCQCTTCMKEAPSDEAIVQVSPSEAIVEEAPSDEAIVQVSPSEAIVEEAPSDEAIVQVSPSEAIAEEAPSDEAIVQVSPSEAIVEEAPPDEAIVRVSPSEAIVEIVPIREAIVEMLPNVEQADVEEAPNDEAIVEMLPNVEEKARLQRPKKVKTDPVLECLICHAVVKRMDKNLQQHNDILEKAEITFIIDFYRTKNVQKKHKIYDCMACYRRFASLVTHKYTNKCDCSAVTRVENPESRA